jgi:hypothetical protein
MASIGPRSVEWSEKRQQWCIEDVEGRCLAHRASIHGMTASKGEAVALAEAMIRDGRMPSPKEARAQAQERRRVEREKRAKPSEIRRREARAAERAAWGRLWEAQSAEKKAQPLYELFDEAFDLADPEIWKSNSFAAFRPRLIIHVKAAIAALECDNPRATERPGLNARRPSSPSCRKGRRHERDFQRDRHGTRRLRSGDSKTSARRGCRRIHAAQLRYAPGLAPVGKRARIRRKPDCEAHAGDRNAHPPSFLPRRRCRATSPSVSTSTEKRSSGSVPRTAWPP